MPLTPPSGLQHVLVDPAAASVAVVTQVGASLRQFSVGGRDVIDPYGIEEIAPAGHGNILAPWPNRLGDGRYTWDGETYQVPITEPDRVTALHGLVHTERWSLLESAPDRVVLGLTSVPVRGYPWQLAYRATYTLAGPALTVEVAATNLSDSDAPYGIGFHPWLSPGPGSLDEASLRLDANAWVRTNERLLPTGTQELPAAFDFRTARRLGATDLDDAFLEPIRDADGLSWVTLRGSDGRTAELWMDESMSAWQVCSGDHIQPESIRRRGLAAEPMSCIADAFNSGDFLVRLSPGATHSVRWGIRLA
ncbi:aldose 1-epimerase family protein [Serinibacter salmoneus]|uniref:Aldose 1-epimerase n=1 Tax=Serinibacter salmoneus TaxID=556530 RepID=A0A2A9D0T2_9MICO|nr:aldose 1-epimerase family protein [Serinibacter salmoneus]PFG20308.1 aldose 1-epimerase [Serinibacter salmoneus]